jgi:hypothetical protein
MLDSLSIGHSDLLSSCPISSVICSISIPMMSLGTPTHTPTSARYLNSITPSSKRFSRKRRQNKCRLVDLFAVVLAQLFFLLLAPCPNRLLDITLAVLAAYHKANLA